MNLMCFSTLFYPTLIIFVATHVGNSLAFKCQVCEKDFCSIEDCRHNILTQDLVTKFLCSTISLGDNTTVKSCVRDKQANLIFGGIDECFVLKKKTYFINILKVAYQALKDQSALGSSTEDENVLQGLNETDSQYLNGTITACTCSSKLCNFQETDAQIPNAEHTNDQKYTNASKAITPFEPWLHQLVRASVLVTIAVFN